MSLKPIGIVRSCFPEKFGTPRQSMMVPEAEGYLELYPWVQPELSLDGLEKFSHLWVISWFHLHPAGFSKAKVHPPRRQGEPTGVFACRSPHRYNPVGLSVFKIKSIAGSKIYVYGLDLVDQTPILDLKPYVPFSDSHPEACGSWADELPPEMEIRFTEEALRSINENTWMPPHQLQSLISKVLKSDPRPVAYRRKKDLEQPYGDTYGFFLHHWNVMFRVMGDATLVLSLEEIPSKSGT